jgi:plastocyanin
VPPFMRSSSLRPVSVPGGRVIIKVKSIVLALAIAVGLDVVTPAGSAFAASSQAVAIADYHFDPVTLSIHAGDTVVWTNAGPSSHTVTADDSSFDAGVIAAGSTFSHTFEVAGTYAYHCAIHPSMKAEVEVAAGPPETTSSTTAPIASTTSVPSGSSLSTVTTRAASTLATPAAATTSSSVVLSSPPLTAAAPVASALGTRQTATLPSQLALTGASLRVWVAAMLGALLVVLGETSRRRVRRHTRRSMRS